MSKTKVEINLSADTPSGAQTRQLDAESVVMITMSEMEGGIEGDRCWCGDFKDEDGNPDIEKVRTLALETAHILDEITAYHPAQGLIFELFEDTVNEELGRIATERQKEAIKDMQEVLHLTDEEVEQLLGVLDMISKKVSDKAEERATTEEEEHGSEEADQ